MLLMLMGAGGVFAVGYYVAGNKQAREVPVEIRREDKPLARTSRPEPEVSTQVERESLTRVIVFTPSVKGEDLSFSTHKEKVPAGTQPMVFAINRFLENTGIMPAGARAVAVEVKDGVALVDVSEPFAQTFGSFDERTLLNGLGKTLAQFDGVKKMQFFISGKPVETLGNVDLTSPIDVTPEPEASTQNGA